MARILLIAAAASTALATWLVVVAQAHSVPPDPAAPNRPADGSPPGADARQVATVVPGAPPQVEAVVNRLKLWRTGTTLPACFLNGGDDLRGFFVSTARTWLERGGLRIDFGATPSHRDCQGPSDRAIRIAFGYQQSGGDWDTGNWSYVGTDINTAPPGPTINIGYAANTNLTQLDQRELRRLVLHEIGHAVALEHEHQSPLALCQFDWTRVLPYYQSRYGWDERKTRFNLGKLVPTPVLQVTPFDPDSIMNYAFPAWMFVQMAGQTCEIKQNDEPSQTDLRSYSALYPGQSQAAVTAQVPASPQEVRTAQEQQDQAVAVRAASAVAELKKLLSDEGQQRQAAELITRIAKEQFPNFKIDLQNNRVNVGNITQKTEGACSPAAAGVGGNVNINSNCTTNSTIETQNNVQGTQNNVQGNQINNSGSINNQGGINFGVQPK